MIAESGLTTEVDLLRLGKAEELCHPRDWMIIAFGKCVVARLRVLLATGEKNDDSQITRSVICFNMREQALATVVQDFCRAYKQRYEVAPSESQSQHEIVNEWTIGLSRLYLIEGVSRSRDWAPIAFVKSVVARLRVSLAKGETNGARQITRSVICSKMREQLLTTVVQDVCRACERIFEEVLLAHRKFNIT